jgi:hypothetical protein
MLKQSDKHCLVGGLEIQTASQTLYGSSQTLSDGTILCPLGSLWKHELLTKSAPFFPNLILEL